MATICPPDNFSILTRSLAASTVGSHAATTLTGCMTITTGSLRTWATSLYLRFRRRVPGGASAGLAPGLIVAAIFVSVLGVLFLEMRSTARLLDELDRGRRTEATVLAYHLERLSLEMLTGEHPMQTPSIKQGMELAPEEVLAEVLLPAYTRLIETLRKNGTFNLADFVFVIETPLGHYLLENRDVRPPDLRMVSEPGAGDFVQSFNLEGRFPSWMLHVGFRGRLAKERSVRYLARMLLLMVMLTGSVLAYRVMQRQVELARARSVFVSNVSHELKTPLSAIRLYNSLLYGMDTDSAEHQEFHQVIDEEVVRLAAMIDNVLEFSHMEQGHVRLNLTMVDLGPLVDQSVHMFRQLYESRGYHFGFAVAENVPPVDADPAAVQQVIANLLDNAVKYSDPHTIWVQIYAAYRLAERFVVVDVQDRGIGIDRNKGHRVFEPFYRAESGLTQRVSGSGLGLAVVKSIVDAHGARVELDSVPGQGTTVRVLFPVASLTELADTT